MDQHMEDTKYVQWADGMYVMLDDLECDYEKALVEDSLRDSIYCVGRIRLFLQTSHEDRLGVFDSKAGLWATGKIKLTRAQALYIATGDTTCTKY
jgi:hypothetical protein